MAIDKDKIAAIKDLRYVAGGLYESMRGSSKGLDALLQYIDTQPLISKIDAISEWSKLGLAEAAEKYEKEEKQKQEKDRPAKGKKPAINATVDRDIVKSIFYDSFRRSYVMQNERGTYLSLIDRQISRRLKARGLSSAKNEFGVSEIDELMTEVEETNDVGYAGPLAGYESGIVEFGQTRALITQGVKLMHSRDSGNYHMIDQIFRTLLGDEQLQYFYAWLHFAVRALDNRTHSPGQAVAIAGKRGCGKSLCQQIITEILGGRSARPYQYMCGLTPFNSDMFCAEHLMIEDEANTTDMRSRKLFGAHIKNVVANKDQRLHGKGKDAVMLQPLWRMTITTNDDDENLMVLPPLEEGLEDKIMLFVASHSDLPMPAGTPEEKAALWNAIMSEIPRFMHFLRSEFAVPEEIEDPRYGVRHYHNPIILAALNKLAPEMNMLMLIENNLITNGMFWEGTQSELTSQLTASDSGCSFEARKLLKWATAAGTYLSRLRKSMPDRVEQHRIDGSRVWRVKCEEFAEMGKGD